MNKTYSKNLRHHAKKRARERYYTEIPRSVLNEMEKQIQGNGKNIIERKRLTASRSLVTFNYNDHVYKVVYSRKFKRIVTFLPALPHK